MKYLLAAIVLVAACAKKDPDGNPFADSSQLKPATPIDSGTYTLADFRRLRWIEGRWRGFMPNGGKFYESYRFLDDSTMEKHSYPDSTFTNPEEPSRIMLRRGVVSDESPRSRYVATHLDSVGVDFIAMRGGTNSFTWVREDSTKWNATIRWNDAQGRPQSVVYALHRFGR